MYSSENAGLVKFDLLGLKTLTVIDKTLKRLKTKNINLNISQINQSDEKVFFSSFHWRDDRTFSTRKRWNERSY